MKTKAKTTTKTTVASKEKKPQVKKSKFAIAWEKMGTVEVEYIDMRAILK